MPSQNNEANDLLQASKERYISPEKIQEIIDELKLISQYNNVTSKNNEFVRQCIKSAIYV